MNNMSAGEPTGVDEAGRLYAAAYAAHYAAGDLRGAFELYRSLVTTHPESAEAGYCQAQILNIVNAVVPKQMILAAQGDLALACFEDVDRRAER